MVTTSGSSSSCGPVAPFASMSPHFIPCFIDLRNAAGFEAAGWRNRANAAGVTTGSRPQAKKFWQRSAMAGAILSRQSVGSPESSMPDFRSAIRARLANLGISPAREIEITEELAQHLEDEYEQALTRGLSPEEAERNVLENLKASDSLDRELRRVEPRLPQNPTPMGTRRRSNMMGDLGQD